MRDADEESMEILIDDGPWHAGARDLPSVPPATGEVHVLVPEAQLAHLHAIRLASLRFLHAQAELEIALMNLADASAGRA